MKLLVATRSAHKLLEIRRILAAVSGLRVVDLNEAGLPPSPEEDDIEAFDTFEENALAKARHFYALSGLPTVADDSGLAVDALDGAPGVRSKRFAPDTEGLDAAQVDRANNEHLLERLGDLPLADRTARFVCVAALVDGSGREHIFRGEAPGLILGRPRGWEGFGYDPLFLDRELGRSFGELTRAEKQARSHRGRAFRALADHLADTAVPGIGS